MDRFYYGRFARISRFVLDVHGRTGTGRWRCFAGRTRCVCTEGYGNDGFFVDIRHTDLLVVPWGVMHGVYGPFGGFCGFKGDKTAAYKIKKKNKKLKYKIQKENDVGDCVSYTFGSVCFWISHNFGRRNGAEFLKFSL